MPVGLVATHIANVRRVTFIPYTSRIYILVSAKLSLMYATPKKPLPFVRVGAFSRFSSLYFPFMFSSSALFARYGAGGTRVCTLKSQGING